MAYRMTTDADHSDLAGGSVLHSAPGFPAFPVRLADELFLRAAAHLPDRPLRLWDPCCGSGYLVTVLGLRHRIGRIWASDADPAAVELARRNLRLLAPEGMTARAAELRPRAEAVAKPGYASAAEAARRLRPDRVVPAEAEVADAFHPAPHEADVVLTDLPYGERTTWLGDVPEQPVRALARALSRAVPEEAIVVLCARTRKVDIGVPALERIRVGTRAAYLGRAGDLR